MESNTDRERVQEATDIATRVQEATSIATRVQEATGKAESTATARLPGRENPLVLPMRATGPSSDKIGNSHWLSVLCFS